jgi:cyclophilin family peptidyl-prolyl cis-trans isomerase
VRLTAPPAPTALAQASPGSPGAAGPAPEPPAAASSPAASPAAAPEAARAAGVKNPVVALETSKGTITLELFEDDAPNTVTNFVSLCESGTYDGTRFHRIIKGFMMQGGDPNTKSGPKNTWGEGGPGYAIDDECGSDPKWKNVRGMISMANAGPNTNGSQFFIIFGDSPHLDGKHTVFGKVTEGMNVVDDIEKTVAPPEGQQDPLTELILKKAVVRHKRDHKYEPVKNQNR